MNQIDDTNLQAQIDRLVSQKQLQAVKTIADRKLDAWLIFVREGGEKILTKLISGVDHIVQNAAFIFTREGRRIALLEPIDIQNGAGRHFETVIEYQYDVSDPLRRIWAEISPETIALNYSRYEFAADGLTHGVYLRLMDALGDLGLEKKMVPAEEVIVELRAVKTPEEKALLKEAARLTVQVHSALAEFVKPETTDSDLARFFERSAIKLGAELAHTSVAVNPVGQNNKSLCGRPIQPGDTIVCDSVVTVGGYSSDIKGLWYVTHRDGVVPEILEQQWHACRTSMTAGLNALAPGRPGFEIHEEAWAALEAQGFKRDNHSYGHQVGHGAHDAGPWLGEKDNLYRPASGLLKEGMFVTLDPTMNRVGPPNPELFCMGLEVMAEVTPEGGKLIHEDQKDIWIIRM